MAWYKVDDALPTSHKVLSIPRTVRLPSIGLWTLAGAWSAANELDGYIPEFMVTELGGTPRVAGALVKAGLWDEVKSGGYQYRNWSEYQPTRAELEAGRAKEAERKRKYREQHRTTDEDRPDDDRGSTEARPSAGQGSVKARPTSSAPAPPDDDRQPETPESQGNTGHVPPGHHPDGRWDTTGSPDTPTRPDPTRPLIDKTDQSGHLPDKAAKDPTDPDLIHVSRYGVDVRAVVEKCEAVYGQTPNGRAVRQVADAVMGRAKNPKNPTAVMLTSIDKDGKDWRAALAGEAVA